MEQRLISRNEFVEYALDPLPKLLARGRFRQYTSRNEVEQLPMYAISS